MKENSKMEYSLKKEKEEQRKNERNAPGLHFQQ